VKGFIVTGFFYLAVKDPLGELDNNHHTFCTCGAFPNKKDHLRASSSGHFSWAKIVDFRKCGDCCRDDWIRTSDHTHPMRVRYQTAPHPVFRGPKIVYIRVYLKAKLSPYDTCQRLYFTCSNSFT
jgi:hypothetical protein